MTANRYDRQPAPIEAMKLLDTITDPVVAHATCLTLAMHGDFGMPNEALLEDPELPEEDRVLLAEQEARRADARNGLGTEDWMRILNTIIAETKAGKFDSSNGFEGVNASYTSGGLRSILAFKLPGGYDQAINLTNGIGRTEVVKDAGGTVIEIWSALGRDDKLTRVWTAPTLPELLRAELRHMLRWPAWMRRVFGD